MRVNFRELQKLLTLQNQVFAANYKRGEDTKEEGAEHPNFQHQYYQLQKHKILKKKMLIWYLVWEKEGGREIKLKA